MSKIVLDLHPIYNKKDAIDRSLDEVVRRAAKKNVFEVEIIYGKGSGQLKKHVLRFLARKDIRAMYHRINKDRHNHGRVLIYFR